MLHLLRKLSFKKLILRKERFKAVGFDNAGTGQVSDARVDKAVQIVNKSGLKNVHSLAQPDQDDNLKRPITKTGNRQTAAEVHLENDRRSAKSTESKINLNRSVPVAESYNKPVIESRRVENNESTG